MVERTLAWLNRNRRLSNDYVLLALELVFAPGDDGRLIRDEVH